ncbi:MAG: hypothetical protein NTX03_00545 [Bacteroidetes bacterium]|nr:hypothetical protein [Bacteroidota bacterium]
MVEALQKSLPHYTIETLWKKGIFKKWNNLKLIFWAWQNANAKVNIVVGRLALSSIFRNWFTNNKTIIVLHYFDERDGKGNLLNRYYQLLFWVLRMANPAKVSIVSVAPFFQDYFKKLFPRLEVFLIPNLFENNIYKSITKNTNPKKIHLGQYSFKQDDDIFTLAEKLKAAGYEPWFCTLRQGQAGSFLNYDVVFDSSAGYQQMLAGSYATIAFTKINEAWNRVAHESLLVGVPVIGYNRGGLGNLLQESNAYIVQNVEEALALITSNTLAIKTPAAFFEKYDSGKQVEYIAPLVGFIKG